MFKDTPESFVENEVKPIAAAVPGDSLLKSKAESTDKIVSAHFLEKLPDVVCLSHLRWDFVYQRPQHLMSRFAQHGRLFFVEEPVFEDVQESYLHISSRGENLLLLVPHLPHGMQQEQQEEVQ